MLMRPNYPLGLRIIGGNRIHARVYYGSSNVNFSYFVVDVTPHLPAHLIVHAYCPIFVNGGTR